MRLWSLHPRYLDRIGLLACWREGLLAQSVLAKLAEGEKPGYRNHPQLDRFKAAENPLRAIAGYLAPIQREAMRRGYRFNADLILAQPNEAMLPVTQGQLLFEMEHLRQKLYERDPIWMSISQRFGDRKAPQAHPLFKVVAGDVELWEKGSND